MHKPIALPQIDPRPDFVRVKTRSVIGVDVFIDSPLMPKELGESITKLVMGTPFKFKMISNRGVQVFPAPVGAKTDCVDHYRCRFMATDTGGDLPDSAIFELLAKLNATHRWMHIEKLQKFDGVDGFAKAQGED